MSNLNLLAQEKPIQPVADLGKARRTPSPRRRLAPHRRQSRRSFGHEGPTVAVCHYRQAAGPVWCQPMDFAVAMLVLAIADRVSGATEERP